MIWPHILLSLNWNSHHIAITTTSTFCLCITAHETYTTSDDLWNCLVIRLQLLSICHLSEFTIQNPSEVFISSRSWSVTHWRLGKQFQERWMLGVDRIRAGGFAWITQPSHEMWPSAKPGGTRLWNSWRSGYKMLLWDWYSTLGLHNSDGDSISSAWWSLIYRQGI